MRFSTTPEMLRNILAILLAAAFLCAGGRAERLAAATLGSPAPAERIRAEAPAPAAEGTGGGAGAPSAAPKPEAAAPRPLTPLELKRAVYDFADSSLTPLVPGCRLRPVLEHRWRRVRHVLYWHARFDREVEAADGSGPVQRVPDPSEEPVVEVAAAVASSMHLGRPGRVCVLGERGCAPVEVGPPVILLSPVSSDFSPPFGFDEGSYQTGFLLEGPALATSGQRCEGSCEGVSSDWRVALDCATPPPADLGLRTIARGEVRPIGAGKAGQLEALALERARARLGAEGVGPEAVAAKRAAGLEVQARSRVDTVTVGRDRLAVVYLAWSYFERGDGDRCERLDDEHTHVETFASRDGGDWRFLTDIVVQAVITRGDRISHLLSAIESNLDDGDDDDDDDDGPQSCCRGSGCDFIRLLRWDGGEELALSELVVLSYYGGNFGLVRWAPHPLAYCPYAHIP